MKKRGVSLHTVILNRMLDLEHIRPEVSVLPATAKNEASENAGHIFGHIVATPCQSVEKQSSLLARFVYPLLHVIKVAK
jgi:hypothetical protein